jgi:hypothetical protein
MHMKRVAVVSLLVSFLCTAAEAREGFGFTKRSATMNLRRPPAIAINASRVKVTATSERTRAADDAQVLRKYVEDALVAGDPRLTLSGSPDVTVAIDLDRLDYDVRSESKVEYESEKTKDKDGKTKYVSVPKTKYYKTVDAEIAGTFKITDARGRSLDAGDIDRKFNEQYEYSVPDQAKITDDLLHGAARKIAARIVPTYDKVTVLVPKGSFEAYAPLAESNSWEGYLRAVQAIPPNHDPAAEAYRQYALGVANEGLAHATSDKRKALELLRAAAENYRTATQSNPGEKLFSERYNSLLNQAEAPLVRVEDSIASYERWVNATPATALASSAPASKTKPAKTMRNETVIEMTRAGLGDDVIIGAIDAASSTSFDTSPDALIELSKSGVSSGVIRRMQQRKAR